MFRFTIRELILLTVIVAMGAAWWVDRRRLKSESNQLRGELFKIGMRLIPLESFEQGTDRIKEILEAAKKSPPPPDAAAEIIYQVRHDPDWRIRVRAMQVLPFLSERAEATTVLIEILRDRDSSKRTAGGVLPLQAAKQLAEMKVTTAADDIRSWLDLLKQNSPYDKEATAILIQGFDRFMAKLTEDEVAKVSDPP